VVRGIYALSRGMGLERLVDTQATPLGQFEQLFMAYVTGAIKPRAGTGPPRQPATRRSKGGRP
jgi:hypothetical protein